MFKKIIISLVFALVSFTISSAQAPSSIVDKKLAIIGSVTELSFSINNQFHFTSTVNQVGRYNVGLSDEDWSLERYNYRKTGEQTANLTIINHDGHQARLLLSFNSPTSGSVSGSYYNVRNELQWSTLDATWTVEDLDLNAIPDTELPSDPSGYYAPANIAGGTLSAQDKYWSVYDETISFSNTGTFSASITNDDPGSPLSVSGTSYTYTKTGTNSATLIYSIDGAGISFEYALQFTGENAGIYSKLADYGGGTTDVTTGPFSLSGVAVPEPVTVVSDPNGQAVVVQVGENYQWNSTLDGVTLWGVWEDDEDGWIGATIKYENGMQKASIGITDQLGNNLEVNHPYIIDENGMVKVTEGTAFQYYQVTAVENGVITTADDSSFPLSDTSKFFTTRAAAEDFYYSKVNPKDWMWFDHYPWVYSNEEQDWLYFYPSGSKLLYWSNKGQAWRQFN